MSDPEPSDELIARFLSGEASAADRLAVETWAASHPDHRAELDRLLAATASTPPGDWDTDRAWQRVSTRLHEAPQVVPLHRAARRTGPLLRWAAAIVILIGAALAWRQLQQEPHGTVYATALGERLEISLEDGTAVVLGPSSSLRVPVGFGQTSRRVDLRGEAWFEASHAAMPFEVQADAYVVRDIGTEFTVQQEPNRTLRVIVVSGEVQVRVAADTSVLLASLLAGDVATVSQPDAQLEPEATIARQQPAQALTSWRTGALEVVDASAFDVLQRLAQWHGIQIDAAPERIAGRTITATLPLDSLDVALDLVATLLDAKVVRLAGAIRLQ
jgi:ferric-dicitrate binding protein FerR (iron transport regulator)